jgi:pectate lyase
VRGELRPSVGVIVERRDGAIIENLDHTGTILIAANNVTLRNIRVTYPASDLNANEANFAMIMLQAGSTNLTIEDCTINGNGRLPYGILAQARITIRRCDISLVAHGANVSNDFLIENNYIHDVSAGGKGWHSNGVHLSLGNNGIIRNNTMIIDNESVTAPVSLFAELGNVSNMLVENNLLAGGSYAVYAQPKDVFTETNVRFINNRFSNMLYPTIGRYGIWYPTLPPDIVRSGNVIHETNQPADK